MELSLVILAAGMGSRFGGLKQVTPVNSSGESIIDFSVFDALRSGFSQVIIITRKDIQKDFHAFFGKRFEKQVLVKYAFQEIKTQLHPKRKKPYGTAHAVLAAKKFINGPFAVINADDFYGHSSFQKAANFLTTDRQRDHHALIGYHLKHTLSEYGTVSRAECKIDSHNNLTGIRELFRVFKKRGSIFYNINGEDHSISEDSYVSMNFWCFKPEIFPHIELGLKDFLQGIDENPNSEFLIPDVANTMIKKSQNVFTVIPTNSHWMGITHREDLDRVASGISSLIQSGLYPSPLWK